MVIAPLGILEGKDGDIEDLHKAGCDKIVVRKEEVMKKTTTNDKASSLEVSPLPMSCLSWKYRRFAYLPTPQ